LAALYRRAAAYEENLIYIDARLDEHDAEIDEHDAQIDELHSRVEGMEEGMRLLPEILERLGPQTLTPEHQATVKNMTRRLSELTGISYAAIYAELDDHFHVAKYDQIPDTHWADIAAWFGRRTDAAEKGRRS
jgi:ORF6C domain